MCSITSQKLPDCAQARADFLLRSFIRKAESHGCIIQQADISVAQNHFLCRCYELCAVYKKGKASLSTFIFDATRHDVSRYWYSFIADKIKRAGKTDVAIDTQEMDVENIPAAYADFRNLLMIQDDIIDLAKVNSCGIIC